MLEAKVREIIGQYVSEDWEDLVLQKIMQAVREAIPEEKTKDTIDCKIMKRLGFNEAIAQFKANLEGKK